MTDSETYQLIDLQQDFVVVDKPAGVNFHDEGEIGSGLFNRLTGQLGLSELYPVHRLDKMTSGLILFARNKSTAQEFQRLFNEHKVEKYYLAISDKKPKKKQGLIKGDMTKSRRGMWKLLRSSENPAISQFFSYGLGSGKRLFIVKPHSGKTHQIRVALNSIGSPIIGDNTYYAQSQADRGYLHAYALRFRLNQQAFQYTLPPNSGELFLDANVQQQITALSTPWDLPWPKL